ncbi:MAG: hypothetical protein ACL93V_08325 [Candidatus Electrothrix sp. YB6]
MKIQARLFFSLMLLTVTATTGPARADIDPDKVQKLLADHGAAEDHLGYSVSVDGNTALIGAYGDDTGAPDAGAAYVFVRFGSRWIRQAKILNPQPDEEDYFGFSVSVDGNTALIGAYGEDSGTTDAGAAYVFVRAADGTWTQQDKIYHPDPSANDHFGKSVSLSGSTALIGVPKDDDAGHTNQGSAYVFTRTGSEWTEQDELANPSPNDNERFGVTLSLSDNTALIGVPYRNCTAPSKNCGSAYVFTRTDSSWSMQELTASDTAHGDKFGSAVSVDGETILIGAPETDDDGANSGSVYVFTRSGSAWSEQDKFTAFDVDAGDRFGLSVAVDGDTAVIGTGSDTDAGSAYIFTRSGSAWNEQVKLPAHSPAAADYFGASVSVDGDTVLIGAYGDDDGAPDAGSAYIYGTGSSISINPGFLPAIYLLLLLNK